MMMNLHEKERHLRQRVDGTTGLNRSSEASGEPNGITNRLLHRDDAVQAN